MGIEYLYSELTNDKLIQVFLCAIGIGMAKTGFGGLGLLVVPIMAGVFGAKSSTGFLLIILILADIFGVAYYHRHADIQKLIKLIPSTIVGILFGVLIGNYIDENQFRIVLVSIILLGVALSLYKSEKISSLDLKSKFIPNLIGFLGGFSTMIGNAAGPVMTIYFLSIGFKKNKFIGTAAWFFLFVNVFKVPFHIIVWKTIDISILLFGLSLLPFIIFGAYTGFWIVQKIPEKPYRVFLITSIFLSTLKLIVLV